MKKVLSFMLMLAVSAAASAQLRVNSSGKVGINRTTYPNFSYADLCVGDFISTYSNYTVGVHAYTYIGSSTASNYVMGLLSKGIGADSSQGRSFGVNSAGGGATTGYNYGVLGSLIGSGNGAGICGTISNTYGMYVSGRYAGYFDGATYVDGTLISKSFLIEHDPILQENVREWDGDVEECGTLKKLAGMNVFTYNFKEKPKPEVGDTAQQALSEEQLAMLKTRHVGLSAQELQEAFPELVTKGQDGYLCVNYVEMVPILVRSIQELQHEIEVLQEEKNARPFAVPTTSEVAAASLQSQAVLYQNTPNPFTEQTVIRFTLPERTVNASICVFDMQGKMLKQIPVKSSDSSVSIKGYELNAGLYLYSLIVDGQEIATKRMVLSK